MKWFTVKIGDWRMPVYAKNERNALAQGIRIYAMSAFQRNRNFVRRGAIAKAKREGGPVYIKRIPSGNIYATVEEA